MPGSSPRQKQPSSAPPSSSGAAVPKKKTGHRSFSATDLALIAVFAALVAASIIVPPIPAGSALGVPITLQTLVITLTGLTLGAARAAAAVGLYVILGLAGLPIFSGFRGGPGALASGSGGYIIGFVLCAATVGWLAAVIVCRTGRAGALGLTVAGLAGLLVSHAAGIVGMMINGRLSLQAAALADVLFVPGDVIKVVLAVIVSISLHRAFPDLLIRRAP